MARKRPFARLRQFRVTVSCLFEMILCARLGQFRTTVLYLFEVIMIERLEQFSTTVGCLFEEMISLRTKRGNTCSFFPEKRTKNLVTQKTRLFIRAIALLLRLPAGFFAFQCPISWIWSLPYRDLIQTEIGTCAAQTILGHSPVPIRGDYIRAAQTV